MRGCCAPLIFVLCPPHRVVVDKLLIKNVGFLADFSLTLLVPGLNKISCPGQQPVYSLLISPLLLLTRQG